jgi:hypothetical protein
VKELFESHQLVQYPSDEIERSHFEHVNAQDLLLIKELDDEKLSSSLIISQPEGRPRADSSSFEDLGGEFQILKNQEASGSVKKYSPVEVIIDDYFNQRK